MMGVRRAAGLVQQRPLGDASIFGVADEKTIVVIVINGMADVDLTATELNAAQFVQFIAGVDTFIFGHIFVFTSAAGGGDHGSPRWQIRLIGCFMRCNFKQ
jgi:hypothetical protein